MKKGICLILVAILFSAARLVSADDMKNMEGMKNKGMMGGKMMGMMGKCSMMQPTIVATSDGGVVVLMGNKLTKYDKNLNLVKEVELKMDVEGMGKMCPMMGKGMGKGMKDNDNDADDDAAEQAEHESHHPAK